MLTLQEVDKVVDYVCSGPSADYGPYKRVGAPAELLPGRFYRYRVIDRDSFMPVDLHVYLDLAGIGGALWEQEVRVLTRASASRLPALPEILGGGAHDAVVSARAGITTPGADFALIATRGSRATLAEQDEINDLHGNRERALSTFMALADALAELHDLGVNHRNLWPEAVYVNDADETWLARFEMSALVADLVRNALTSPADALQALREMYVRQGALSLAYCPPERLGFIFPDEQANTTFEGPPADVYGLGVLACEIFGAPLDREELAQAWEDGVTAVRQAAAAAVIRLRESLKETRLPRQLTELILSMLADNAAHRPTAAMVAGTLHSDFETISAYLEDRAASQPYLLLYLPKEFAGTVQKWFLTHDWTTTVGRRDLGAFIAGDLRRARLVHVPEGAIRFAGGDDPIALKAAEYVLFGEQVAWFCKKWEPRRNGPVTDRALIIKYVARLQGGASASRLAELARNPLSREVPEIVALPSDVERSVITSQLEESASWGPLLRAVSSVTAASADDIADEAALDLLLRYQGVELRARTYAYECEDPARGEIEVVLDPERDRKLITGDALLTMYASDPRRRPPLGDFFGRLENDEGSAEVEIVADDRGKPAPAVHRSEWFVARRTGPDRIRLRPKSGQPAAPQAGWVRPADFYGTWTSIQRQTEARWDLADSTQLLHQLRRPASIRTLPYRWSRKGGGLTGEESRETVRAMLSYLPFYAVQGPPGTGKTTVAAEAVAAQLEDFPATRILVSAQSSFALDHLAERILNRIGAVDDRGEPTDWWDGAALRVTSSSGTPPQGKMGLWRKNAVAERRRDLIVRRVTEHLDGDLAGRLPDGNADKLRHVLRDWKGLLDGSGRENVLPELEDRAENAANLVFATCGTATAEAVTPGGIRDTFNWVIVEEAAKAWPTELALPLTRGTRWTLIGDHRQLPAYRREDFERFLSACLDDDDPAINLLGERKEDVMDVFDTFRRVFRQADSGGLSAAARQQLPLHTLSTQFRMAKPIAEVVSRVFYPVAGAEPEPDGLLPGRLGSGRDIGPLPLRAPAPLRGKSLVWLDTSQDPDCATDFPTWSNPGEADVVADLIRRIVPVPRPHRDGYSADPLAVLTPYRRQADLLRAAPHVKPHVYTVHAFQGREADIVVVSLVRSALRGTEPTERPWESLGHLSRRELINVMISRARQLLVLVGNYDHFATFSHGEAGFWGQVCRAVELYGSIVPSGSLRG